jgi:hypothetical protein
MGLSFKAHDEEKLRFQNVMEELIRKKLFCFVLFSISRGQWEVVLLQVICRHVTSSSHLPTLRGSLCHYL